jgi:hypothetical protein
MRALHTTLAALLLLLAGCKEEPATPLAELAARAPVPAEVGVTAAPAVPLAAVIVRQPGRFLEPVKPLLGLAEDVAAARAEVARIGSFSGLYAEVLDVRLGFDEEAGLPRLEAAELQLAARPAAGSAPADLKATWQPVLEALPAFPDGRRIECTEKAPWLLCRPGSLPVDEAFIGRAAAALDGAGAEVRIDLDMPRLLAVLEELLTPPLLWAVAPEELRRFEALRIHLQEKPDRLAVELQARESGLVAALARTFTRPERPLAVPVDLPVVAYASVTDVEQRLEAAQEFWDDKVAVPKGYRVASLLNDSWKSQMLELASGLVGVALVGEVGLSELDPGSPLQMPGLVYFIQPAERQAMEARLKHVFNTKYFTLEDETLEGGETLTRAFWKKSGKKRPRERLAWLYEEGTGTYLFGPSELLLAFLKQRREAPPESVRRLELNGDEALRIAFAPGRFVRQLTASQKAGIGAAMALGMVKNSLGPVDTEIAVRVRHEADADGRSRLLFETDGGLATLEELVAKADALLQLLPSSP